MTIRLSSMQNNKDMSAAAVAGRLKKSLIVGTVALALLVAVNNYEVAIALIWSGLAMVCFGIVGLGFVSLVRLVRHC